MVLPQFIEVEIAVNSTAWFEASDVKVFPETFAKSIVVTDIAPVDFVIAESFSVAVVFKVISPDKSLTKLFRIAPALAVIPAHDTNLSPVYVPLLNVVNP